MKKWLLVISYWLLVIGLYGCATTTMVIKGAGPDPAGDAYKMVLIENETPLYGYIPRITTHPIIMEPGTEMIIEHRRPLRWLSPTFGRFSFIVYFYRKFDGKNLDEFVGQQEYWVYLNGYPRIYKGRVFGYKVILGAPPVSSFGHPDRWKGSFGGIIPWRAEFRHY